MIDVMWLTQIEVTLEIGHHAAKRTIPTKEGYTHDWIIYVKPDNKQLVDKVQFYLHPTFKNPKRGYYFEMNLKFK